MDDVQAPSTTLSEGQCFGGKKTVSSPSSSTALTEWDGNDEKAHGVEDTLSESSSSTPSVPIDRYYGELDDSITPAWRGDLALTLEHTPLAFTKLGKFACSGQLLFVYGNDTNILCFDISVSHSPLCILEFNSGKRWQHIYSDATVSYPDTCETWRVKEFAVDESERQEGSAILAIHLVNIWGFQSMRILRLCPKSRHAEVIAQPTIGMDHTAPGSDMGSSLQILGQNVMILNGSRDGALLIDREDNRSLRFATTHAILQMMLSRHHLIYLEHVEAEHRDVFLVIVALEHLWNSPKDDILHLDDIAASRILLNITSPAKPEVHLAIQDLDTLGEVQTGSENIRVTALEVFGSSQAGPGFGLNWWTYTVRRLPRADHGEFDICLERFLHEDLHSFNNFTTVNWSPLSRSQSTIARCTDSCGSTRFIEVCLPVGDAAFLATEDGTGESHQSGASFFPLVIPFKDEDGREENADAVRKVAVDTWSTMSLWSTYTGGICLVVYD